MSDNNIDENRQYWSIGTLDLKILKKYIN
jgi:hypothetical protein